jgi:hypothetical protein
MPKVALAPLLLGGLRSANNDLIDLYPYTLTSMIRVTGRAAASMSRLLGARPGAPFDYLAASPGKTTL